MKHLIILEYSPFKEIYTFGPVDITIYCADEIIPMDRRYGKTSMWKAKIFHKL